MLRLASRTARAPRHGIAASRAPTGARRCLDLHEYQSKELMAHHGVRVQRGRNATTPDEAEAAAKWVLESKPDAELVVKAQVYAGGRGKGHFTNGYKSGVHFSYKPEEVREIASHMIGSSLVTKQTTAEGQPCNSVLVHEGISFDRELYFAIVLDRAHGGPVIVASKQGGMDIEEVAESSPDAIFTVPIDIERGITDAETGEVADKLGFEGEQRADAMQQMANMYKLFVEADSVQLEINPFVVATDGKVYCVDAKIGFDESAAFRQKELFAKKDSSMEDPREVAAAKHGLNYIGLDGNIGCLVNGAGLAMATMDICKLHGGEPANFLDVGGGATEQQVEEAFKILTADPKVEALLVNIFGGIMKCDVIAQGVVNAAAKMDLKLPLVVRLEGTNVEAGNRIISESPINAITAVDLDDAAIKAVAAIKANK